MDYMDYIQNISGIWLVLDKFYVSKYLHYKILILHFGTTEKNKIGRQMEIQKEMEEGREKTNNKQKREDL